jgi:hypothetical protein
VPVARRLDGGAWLSRLQGGRWRVHLVSFADCASALAAYDANGNGDLDYASEVSAALASGAAVDEGVVKSFECPVIPLSKKP